MSESVAKAGEFVELRTQAGRLLGKLQLEDGVTQKEVFAAQQTGKLQIRKVSQPVAPVQASDAPSAVAHLNGKRR